MDRLAAAQGQLQILSDTIGRVIRANGLTGADLADEVTQGWILDALQSDLDKFRSSRLRALRDVWPGLLDADKARDILDAAERRGLSLDQLTVAAKSAKADHPKDGRAARSALLEAIDGQAEDKDLGPLAEAIQGWRKVRDAKTALAVYTINNAAGVTAGSISAAAGGPIGAIVGAILIAISALLEGLSPLIAKRIQDEADGIMKELALPAPSGAAPPEGDRPAPYASPPGSGAPPAAPGGYRPGPRAPATDAPTDRSNLPAWAILGGVVLGAALLLGGRR